MGELASSYTDVWYAIFASKTERARIRKFFFFHSHMGNQKNVVSRKLLIFSILLMEQKMFLFDNVIEISDEPARPGQTRPATDAL